MSIFIKFIKSGFIRYVDFNFLLFFQENFLMHLRRPGKDIEIFVDLDFQRHILEKGLEKILFIVLQRRLTSYETHAQRWETFFCLVADGLISVIFI